MTDTQNTDPTRTIARQQHEMLQAAQERTAAWMTRRQAALETGLDTLKRMAACKTPLEAAVVYSEWLSGSMTRVLADVEDVQKASRSLFASPLGLPLTSPPAAQAETPAPHQLREAA